MKTVALWQDKCIDGRLLVANVVQLFQLRQLNVDDLLRGTGLFLQDLGGGTIGVSPQQLLQLIDNGLRLWPGQDLAFLLGQNWLPARSGPLTHGLMCARNLEQALAFWHRFHWLSHPWIQGQQWQHQRQRHWLLQLDLGADLQQQFFIELTLSTLMATVKRLTGEQLPWRITLPYSRPAHHHHYSKYLGPSLSYDYPVCQISLPEADLSRPLALSDTAGFQLAWQQTRHQWQQHPFHGGLPRAVQARLHRRTHLGDPLPQVAADLGMSPATMKRKLKEYRLTFSQLQDRSRLLQALFLLTIEGAVNDDVARQLQFADGGNFRRSFKRWTGLLPSQLQPL